MELKVLTNIFINPPSQFDVCTFFFFNEPATTEIYTRKIVRQRQMCIRDSPTPSAWKAAAEREGQVSRARRCLSLIHISEPTRLLSISYAVFCLKKKKK